MRKVVPLFLLVLSLGFLKTMAEDNGLLRLRLSTGFGCYASTDKLLNANIYKGFAVFPVLLKSSWLKNKNQFQITFSFNHARMDLINAGNLYYEFNYIKMRQNSIRLAYLRNLAHLGNKLDINLGAMWDIDLITQRENYKSILYDYASGCRKSYFFSMFNISPALTCSYSINSKNKVRLEGSYTPINFSARPNDDFVKQLKLNDAGMIRSFLSFHEFKAFNFSLTYFRSIAGNLDIEFGVEAKSIDYTSADEYIFLNKQLLLGVSKKF